jgi:hypothetical protein
MGHCPPYNEQLYLRIQTHPYLTTVLTPLIFNQDHLTFFIFFSRVTESPRGLRQVLMLILISMGKWVCKLSNDIDIDGSSKCCPNMFNIFAYSDKVVFFKKLVLESIKKKHMPNARAVEQLAESWLYLTKRKAFFLAVRISAPPVVLVCASFLLISVVLLLLVNLFFPLFLFIICLSNSAYLAVMIFQSRDSVFSL